MSTPSIEPDPILGAVVSHHPSDRGRPLLIAAIVAGSAAVALNFTLAELPFWWAPALTIVIMALLALGLGWWVLHLWNREVILYERGFSYREGSRVIPFLYAEVAAVRLRAERRAYFGGRLPRDEYCITIRTLRDEQIAITNAYRRVAELAAHLSERVGAALAPGLAVRLERGERIVFAETLALDNSGLYAGERVLRWAEFGGSRIGGRALALLDANGAVWHRLPLAEIDNVTLLIDLLRTMKAEAEA